MVHGDGGKHEQLTRREFEVLRQVARGLSNQQIARSLGISINTVRTHLRSAFHKLGASNRTEAVTRLFMTDRFK